MLSSKQKFELGDYGFVKDQAWQHFLQGTITEHQWERISQLCKSQLALENVSGNKIIANLKTLREI